MIFISFGVEIVVLHQWFSTCSMGQCRVWNDFKRMSKRSLIKSVLLINLLCNDLYLPWKILIDLQLEEV